MRMKKETTKFPCAHYNRQISKEGTKIWCLHDIFGYTTLVICPIFFIFPLIKIVIYFFERKLNSHFNLKITPYYVARGNLLLQEIHSIWFKAKRIFLRLWAPSISIHQCNNKVGPANSCLDFVLTDHGPNIIDCQPFDTKTYIATFFL